MNKKRLILALCAIALATSALAFSSQARFRHSAFVPNTQAEGNKPGQSPASQTTNAAATPQSVQQQQPVTSSLPPESVIPKHVIYGILFGEIAAFKQKSEDKEGRGEDASFLRNHHKTKLRLNDQQLARLHHFVAESNREVAAVDRKAKRIIDAIRPRHPEGRLAPGEQLPAPPEELRVLQQQRDDLILAAREQLRIALGEAEFQRLDKFLEQEFARKIRPVEIAPRHTQLPNGPRQ